MISYNLLGLLETWETVSFSITLTPLISFHGWEDFFMVMLVCSKILPGFAHYKPPSHTFYPLGKTLHILHGASTVVSLLGSHRNCRIRISFLRSPKGKKIHIYQATVISQGLLRTELVNNLKQGTLFSAGVCHPRATSRILASGWQWRLSCKVLTLTCSCFWGLCISLALWACSCLLWKKPGTKLVWENLQ